ncbi:Ankyrin repeat domain-containing protein 27 [Hondaea fermentalgiana]|uniref:Ankyrin repeat domain-containing protein 27 n=1 Tax=Hondaea fermentalgiana TaxID=2315210 RepID=A0A2R5GRD7_9STRA|nr:Ankyrin repeat domain-containing protein 27 [Hondaea fermentalgiana]|eukprot:GBG33410.1 Ankyrin repeat domain-containing protein 27 [Hondaea fermentalgiana]
MGAAASSRGRLDTTSPAKVKVAKNAYGSTKGLLVAARAAASPGASEDLRKHTKEKDQSDEELARVPLAGRGSEVERIGANTFATDAVESKTPGDVPEPASASVADTRSSLIAVEEFIVGADEDEVRFSAASSKAHSENWRRKAPTQGVKTPTHRSETSASAAQSNQNNHDEDSNTSNAEPGRLSHIGTRPTHEPLSPSVVVQQVREGAELTGLGSPSCSSPKQDIRKSLADPKMRSSVLLSLVPLAETGDGEVDELLGESMKEADPATCDAEGNTLLIKAVEFGKPGLVRAALRRGCAVNAQNSHGFAALHFACYRSSASTKVAKRLLEAGADPDILDNHGVSPLHYAAAEGSVALLALLLFYKAKVDIKDDCGCTALDYAAQTGSEQCVTLLQNKMPRHGSWQVSVDPVSRCCFYVNRDTGETSWQRPQEEGESKVASRPQRAERDIVETGGASNKLVEEDMDCFSENDLLASVEVTQASVAAAGVVASPRRPASQSVQRVGKKTSTTDRLEAKTPEYDDLRQDNATLSLERAEADGHDTGSDSRVAKTSHKSGSENNCKAAKTPIEKEEEKEEEKREDLDVPEGAKGTLKENDAASRSTKAKKTTRENGNVHCGKADEVLIEEDLDIVDGKDDVGRDGTETNSRPEQAKASGGASGEAIRKKTEDVLIEEDLDVSDGEVITAATQAGKRASETDRRVEVSCRIRTASKVGRHGQDGSPGVFVGEGGALCIARSRGVETHECFDLVFGSDVSEEDVFAQGPFARHAETCLVEGHRRVCVVCSGAAGTGKSQTAMSVFQRSVEHTLALDGAGLEVVFRIFDGVSLQEVGGAETCTCAEEVARAWQRAERAMAASLCGVLGRRLRAHLVVEARARGSRRGRFLVVDLAPPQRGGLSERVEYRSKTDDARARGLDAAVDALEQGLRAVSRGRDADPGAGASRDFVSLAVVDSDVVHLVVHVDSAEMNLHEAEKAATLARKLRSSN